MKRLVIGGSFASLGIAALTLISASFLSSTPVLRTAASEQSTLPRLEILRELTGRGSAFNAVWSSDGSKIAAYGSTNPRSGPLGNLVTVWGADGQQIQEIHRLHDWYDTGSSLGFVDGDRKLVTPGPPSVPSAALSVFDIESGQIVRDVPGLHPDEWWNVNSAAAFAVTSDESVIAVAFGRALAQPVSLYSTETWKLLETLPEPPQNPSEETEHLVFSADSNLLAYDRLGPVWIYDRDRRRIVQKINPFPEFNAIVGSLAFSPDASLIAIATGSPTGSVENPNPGPQGPLFLDVPIPEPVRVYRIADGSLAAAFKGEIAPIYSMTWSPDGRVIAFCDPVRLYLWDPSQRDERERVIDLRSTGMHLAFSPDGKKLAVDYASGPLTIFSVLPSTSVSDRK